MGNPAQTKNREAWLTEVARQVQPLFRGWSLPDYRVTCGWPVSNGLGRRRRTVGQCFGAESSKGKTFELFISPLLEQPLEVAGTLCHELAHVAAGVAAKHGGRFVSVCRAVGLTKGKPREVMPGARMEEQIQRIIDVQGLYPHAAIVPVMKRVEKVPSSIALECPECGCRVSMSLKWLDESGPPTCGCGSEFMAAEPKK